MDLPKIFNYAGSRLILLLFLVNSHVSNAQNTPKQPINSWNTNYNEACNKIGKILADNGSFADAVFIRENTFKSLQLSYSDYQNSIKGIGSFISRAGNNTKLKKYSDSDSLNYSINHSIFSLLFDSVAILDLAKDYEFLTQCYDDGFILKCCDLVLQYHPVNPMALLLKAETLQKLYRKQLSNKNPDSANTYKEMEMSYVTLAKLHYREMPEKMYIQWLNSLTRNKYSNQNLKNSLKIK